MQKIRPKDYNYYPKTWLFPQESNLLHKYIKETKNPQKKKYFILKPANGAMGMGYGIDIFPFSNYTFYFSLKSLFKNESLTKLSQDFPLLPMTSIISISFESL